MNPYNSTREDFTDHLMRRPEGYSAEWLESVEPLQALLSHLAHHKAMDDTGNIKQKFMETAHSKNRVYFMWDFIGKTIAMYFNVNPKKKESEWDEEEQGFVFDAIGRTFMGAQLILDDRPGMLNQLVEQTYPDQKGQHPEFGEEILADARRCLPKKP